MRTYLLRRTCCNDKIEHCFRHMKSNGFDLKIEPRDA